MKSIFNCFIVLLFCSFNAFANGIVLEDYYKVLETFSGDIEKKETFHIIIAKNKGTKKYEIIPISYFDNNLVRLKPIVFKSKPSIQSYHSKNNVITLLISEGLSYPIRKFALDINMKTGEHLLSKSITTNKQKATLRKTKKSFLITTHYNDLKIFKIDATEKMDSIKISKNRDNTFFLKGIGKNRLQAVNTDEFVENGPTSIFKAYCGKNDVLYFTKDDDVNNTTCILKIHMGTSQETKIVLFKQFTYERFIAAREVSSYFHDNKLYELLLSKEEGLIRINNVQTGDTSSLVLYDTDFYNKGKDFTNLKSFLKQATKNKYKSTIAVNESKNNELIIRCDYVSPETYSYNSNWWWHHEQFMWHNQFQQQQIRNSLPSFGPSYLDYEINYNYPIASDGHYFELVIDKDTNKIISKTSEVNPKFKFIDKSSFTKSVDENESLDFVSSIFLEDLFVYFYLDNESNSFKVSNKPIY